LSHLASVCEKPKNSSSARGIILQLEQHYKDTVAHMVKNVEYVDFVRIMLLQFCLHNNYIIIM